MERPRYNPDNSFEARRGRARAFGFILPIVLDSTPERAPASPDCFITTMGDMPDIKPPITRPKPTFRHLEALPSLEDNVFYLDNYRHGDEAA